ncbi:MAG: TNT domain-containing protein, partial [[Mycobacterium] stephanolepidis]
KQLCAAGGQANDELAAAIHATDASGTTSPSGAAGVLPDMPGSSIKPEGSRGALQNLAAPNPDGDPGATKAAGAGTDTQANYKEWYPKNTVPVGDKNVDPSKLGGVGSIPGVRDVRDQIPQRMSPTLQAKDVPAFKDLTRQNLQRQGVPADQIEQRVNDAVTRAQSPHFLPDAEQMRTPGQVPLHNSPGDQFNNFVGRANDAATNTVDSQIEQAKILTGQAGPGAPGVAEAWKDHALAAAKQIADPLAIPKMAIQDAQDLYNNPAEFVGKKMIEGPEALAALPLGGEGAAGTRGLLGDLTHSIDDGPTGHHAPIDHPTSPGGSASLPTVDQTPPPLHTDSPLFDGYHQTPPGPEFTKPDGSLIYPDDSLPSKPYAVPHTVIDNAEIPKGAVLDRFGYPAGEWLSPEGTPFAERALPPGSAAKPYFQYVVDDPAKLPPGWRIEQSQVAPWFNQPGGGIQYRVIAPSGVEPSVQELINWGFLKPKGD